MAESVHPQTGIGPDATEAYALGSSAARAPGYSGGPMSWPPTAPPCWTGSVCGRGRARSISAAARVELLTCWPGGCHPAAGSSASMLTRRTPPWQLTSPPARGWATWRS